MEQALQVAERLRLTLAETPITAETEPLHITVSIGLTVTGPGSVDLNTLLKQADEALYKAKDNGRNRVEVFQTTVLTGGNIRFVRSFDLTTETFVVYPLRNSNYYS